MVGSTRYTLFCGLGACSRAMTVLGPGAVIEIPVRSDRAAVVEFVPAANGVTVRVTFDAETTHPEEQQRQGWQAILNNFAKHVVAKDKAEK
jgi:hypothetical protein